MRQPNPEDVGDAVTATWPRQLFSPTSYNSVEVGPWTSTSTIRADETRAQALARVQEELNEFAAGERERLLEDFCRTYAALKQAKAGVALFPKDP